MSSILLTKVMKQGNNIFFLFSVVEEFYIKKEDSTSNLRMAVAWYYRLPPKSGTAFCFKTIWNGSRLSCHEYCLLEISSITCKEHIWTIYLGLRVTLLWKFYVCTAQDFLKEMLVSLVRNQMLRIFCKSGPVKC